MSTRARFIKSAISELSLLWLYPFPTRPFKAVKAMRVGTTHVAIGDNGRIYTSQAATPSHWSSVNRMAPTIDALIAFGILSPQSIQQHKEAAAAESAARDRRYAACAVLEAYAVAGIKLTAAQLKKLQTASAKEAA